MGRRLPTLRFASTSFCFSAMMSNFFFCFFLLLLLLFAANFLLLLDYRFNDELLRIRGGQKKKPERLCIGPSGVIGNDGQVQSSTGIVKNRNCDYTCDIMLQTTSPNALIVVFQVFHLRFFW
jgi:hypothetical protein